MQFAQRQHIRLLAMMLCGLLIPVSVKSQQREVPGLSTGHIAKKFDFSSYFQLRFTGNENSPNLFALRRFKLVFHGNLTPHVQYYVQGIFLDGNGTSVDGHVHLQEAWVKLTRWNHAHLTIGQFKPPFGMERFTPDWEIFTIERSQATKRLVPNGQMGDSFARGRGVQVDGWLDHQRSYYAVGVFDGNAANQPFHGNGPLVAGRVVRVLYQTPAGSARPAHVTLGGAVSTRRDHNQDFAGALPGTSAFGYMHFSGNDTRLNLEASADYGPASFRGEYFYVWFLPNLAPLPEVQADGFYTQSAWRFLRVLQAVAQYEAFNPQLGASNSEKLHWTTLGLNWYLRDNRVRLSSNYVFKRGAPATAPNNALLIQFQFFLH